MTPEVKEKVLAALNTGKYKKCKNQLFAKLDKQVKHMCILGVVDDVYRQTHNLPMRRPGDGAYLPSNEVLKWAGITPEEADIFANRNDDDDVSLRALAKMNPRVDSELV